MIRSLESVAVERSLSANCHELSILKTDRAVPIAI